MAKLVNGSVADYLKVAAVRSYKCKYFSETTNDATAFKVKLPELLSCVTANQRVCP